MLMIYIPVAILFLIAILIRLITGIAIAEFTRDPLGFTGIPVYTGSISNLGVMIWSGAVAICFFSWSILRSVAVADQTTKLLLAGGIVTLVLALDDLFMLHEVVFPDNLGVPEEIVYASYAALILWLLIAFRKTILQSSFLLLVLAILGFGISIASDAVAPYVAIPAMYLFEDGGKLFGIVSWASYFTLVSARHIIQNGHFVVGGRPSSASARGASYVRSHTP